MRPSAQISPVGLTFPSVHTCAPTARCPSCQPPHHGQPRSACHHRSSCVCSRASRDGTSGCGTCVSCFRRSCLEAVCTNAPVVPAFSLPEVGSCTHTAACVHARAGDTHGLVPLYSTNGQAPVDILGQSLYGQKPPPSGPQGWPRASAL